jgi:hypothetical protein
MFGGPEMLQAMVPSFTLKMKTKHLLSIPHELEMLERTTATQETSCLMLMLLLNST